MQGAGWTKVYSKRSGFKWDVFPFGGRNRGPGLAAVTSFFVSEFPDYVNAKSLFELFGCSGKIVDVAISPRKTRLGIRFAFARFLDVVDGRALAVRLDNIMIEGKKIHVNLPRFNRAQVIGAGKQGSSSSGGNHVISSTGGNQGKFSGIVRGGSGTYAEIVAMKGRGLVSNKEEAVWLKFHSNQILRSRFERAFVGRVCIPGSAYNIQTHLEMEGIFSIKVTPIGGNCCLLEEMEVGFIDELIKEGETWWRSWFDSIEKWEPGKVDGYRDVWMRIFGVLIHVWSPEFFVALGEKWGRFVCIDDNTAKGEAFDVARILINIPITLSIPEHVNVCIDGSIFRLCIREDTQGIYHSVSGLRKASSSDGTSSETDSDKLLLSDSGNSSKSKVRVVFRDVNKESNVEAPAVLFHLDNFVGASVEGCNSGNKGPSVADSDVKRSQSEGFLYRSGVGVSKSDLGNFCKVKADTEVTDDHQLVLRGREAKFKSKRLKLGRVKGDSHSGSRVSEGHEYSKEECSEDVPIASHRSTIKGSQVGVHEEVRCLPTGSICKCVSDDEIFADKASFSMGTVAAETNLNLDPARRCREDEDMLNLLELARNTVVTHDQECTADSIESFESALCPKQVNSLSSGSEEVKVPATEDFELSLDKSDCSGLNPGGSSSFQSNCDVVSHGALRKAGSSEGGGIADYSVNTGNRSILLGTLADSKGSSDIAVISKYEAVFLVPFVSTELVGSIHLTKKHRGW